MDPGKKIWLNPFALPWRDKFGGEKTAAFVIVLAILFAAIYLVMDIVHEGRGFGWDAAMICAGTDAWGNGLDPYYVKNLVGTHLYYPYPPFTLAMFAPVCAHGFLARHFGLFYSALAAAAAFLIAGASEQPIRARLCAAIFVFFGFDGFQWALRCGNASAIDGFFIALALFLLYRGVAVRKDGADSHPAVLCSYAGAAVLGFSAAIKVSYSPVLLGLLFFPATRMRKGYMLLLALTVFALLLLMPALFQHELFPSWFNSMRGRIPGQHPISMEDSRSLLSVAAIIAGYPARGAFIIAAAIYALFVAGIVLPLGYRIMRMPLKNPRFALHVMTLTMLMLFLCTPRIGEYAYFEMVIYAAMLLGNLSLREAALVFAFGVALPLVPGAAHVKFYSTLWNGYVQLAAAVASYFAFLFTLPAVSRRLERGPHLTATQREAQTCQR